ncbi:helix-turn-helix domain-containing protein [Longispora sp. NPDC051575]|uniref:helix-turn-helix domain-containing protein n=1 Tax=Longispora sp. NPDC051575 TaxID=3154943 RepID=UPI00343A5A36
MNGTPVPVRTVHDAETLKVLSDPLRLAILRTLGTGAGSEPPVMSVKELARELAEPQTKLYRHVKQLEACGLIQVAESRLVNGILEQRYRTGQLTLRLDPGLMAGHAGATASAGMVGASFDEFRDGYLAAISTGRVSFTGEQPAEPDHLRPLVFTMAETIPSAQAAEFRERLAALVKEFSLVEQEGEGIPVRFFTAFYSPR